MLRDNVIRHLIGTDAVTLMQNKELIDFSYGIISILRYVTSADHQGGKKARFRRYMLLSVHH